jgi:hypothetical protein|tara:strand:- start:1671 stop:1907 length:237 start_codon:yes stop_codon:yes gene_type:complete
VLTDGIRANKPTPTTPSTAFLAVIPPAEKCRPKPVSDGILKPEGYFIASSLSLMNSEMSLYFGCIIKSTSYFKNVLKN